MGWILSVILTLRPADRIGEVLVWVMLALIGVGAVGTSFPVVRMGPRARPVWLRAAGWIVSTLVVAVIGAVVSRLLFPV